MKNRKFTRRELLIAAGLATDTLTKSSILRVFLGTLVSGRIASARRRAASTSLSALNARNFIQINMYGAPSRQFFDHPLRPNDTDGFLATEGMYNSIKNIDYDEPHKSTGHYRDIKIAGINMPHLWQNKVAAVGGKSRDMTELMRNMLMIRGCELASDGHPINCERQVSPLKGGLSITGLVADANMEQSIFPAISVGCSPANKAFKSEKNIGPIDIPLDTEDYISYLLEAFYKSGKADNFHSQEVEKEIELALGQLKHFSMSNQTGAELMYNERDKAEKFLRSGVANFSDIFSKLTEKYETLFERSIDLTPIDGVTDRLIPGLKFPAKVENYEKANWALASHRFDGNGFLICPDLRKVFSKAKAENFAKGMALAEFVVTEGLSSSVLITPPNHDRGNMLVNLMLENSIYSPGTIFVKKENGYNVFEVAKNTRTKKMDQPVYSTDCHSSGWISNILACSIFYRGMSACMLEMIDQLKAKKLSGDKNLFDETVIQYASEFERAPQINGSGSQHNYLSCVTSLYSGIIKKPEVIGNIYVGKKEPYKTTFPTGTIGTAAPIDALKGRKIKISNISSTLSEMLRVPKIVGRAESLVEVNESTLKTTIEPGKNIEDV